MPTPGKRVHFKSRGNGYHDVHFDGVHQKHLDIIQSDRSNGNYRYGGGTYGLYHLQKKKYIMTGTRAQIKSKLERYLHNRDQKKNEELVERYKTFKEWREGQS